MEVDGELTLPSVSSGELSTEKAPSCVCATASVKWASRRSRLKNFSLHSLQQLPQLVAQEFHDFACLLDL